MEVLRTFEHEGKVVRLFAPGVESESMPVSAQNATDENRHLIGQVQVLPEGEEATLTARIDGKDLAYVYSELLIKDPESPRYYGPLTREHVRARRERQTGGLLRPDWGEVPAEVVVSIRLNLRLLTDGFQWALFCPLPERYGGADYRLAGLYARAAGAGPSPATLVVDGSGAIRRITIHRRHGRRSMPRTLLPTPGDRFGPFVQVLTPANGEGAWETTTALASWLTFSDRPWRLDLGPAMPGDYLAGFVLEDLDGGLTRQYVPLVIDPTER